MNQQYYQPYGATSAPPLPGATSAPPLPGAGEPITTPTCRDVLQGRGQGVQRHPGNVKYRTLVFVNKGLYAKCPRTDKIKISKGIVAAVRELGGRFLELDERTSIYMDIGDKKATEKTSQALREGQTQIRKQIYKEEEMSDGANGGSNSAYDTSLLDRTGGVPMPSPREISAEGYFGYSVQVLESLYSQEEGASNNVGEGAVGSPDAPPPLPAQTIANVAPSSSVAYAMALDQFPGAVQAQQQQQMPPPPNRASIGRFTDASFRITDARFSRLTGMSLGSMFSISSVRQLLESARHYDDQMMDDGPGDRGSIKSLLSSEIRDLILLSEPQLTAVEENMAQVDENSSGGSGSYGSHEDKEVMVFDEDKDGNRVSELRFTDVARDFVAPGINPANGGEPNPRLTESTEYTTYSKTSLMDASFMSIPMEDMSAVGGDRNSSPSGSSEKEAKRKGGEVVEDAELLMRLSTDHIKNVSQV